MMRITAERLERWVWYVFVATAAWQTRIILWQADVQFIEWRSGSLYASDVLMVALFVIAIVRGRSWFVRRMIPADWLLGFFVAFAVLSLAHADHLTVGIFGLIRLVQGMLFYLYLRHWAWGHFHADRTAVAFVAGALLQGTLGITQYLLQHDVGLRLLGEPLVRTDMRGVAVFYNIHFTKILRAYGTFPHPNVLAAYLMTSLWVAVWLWVRHTIDGARYRWVWPVLIALLTWAFYLTFARTVIAVWLATMLTAFAVVYVRRLSDGWPGITTIRKRAVTVAATFFVVSVCFLVIMWPTVVARMTISASDEAVRLRLQYNDDAVASGARSAWDINWTGVGIGNFTTWLSGYDVSMPSYMYQPAHNVYLLVYSEVGLVGLIVLLAWIAYTIRASMRAYALQPAVRFGIVALVAAVLLIGLLDHFYWTLQQGRMLWWAALALAAGRAS